MHRPVVKTNFARIADPGQGMLHPVFIVPVGEILPSMTPSALLAIVRAMHGHQRTTEHVLQLQRLDQIGIPDHGAIGDLELAVGLPDLVDTLAP